MYLEYVTSNAEVNTIVLKEDEVEAILPFLEEAKIKLTGDCYCYIMSYEEICSISRRVDEEAIVAMKVEKEYEYEAVLSKETFQYHSVLLKLADYFEMLVKMKVSEAIIYFSIDNLAVPLALDEKLLAAVAQQSIVNSIVESNYYTHFIDLPFSAEKNFFEQLEYKANWGIAFIEAEECLNRKNYIPLKGYEVRVETTSKAYFTGAFEITYTAYHIQRNSKDHRYSYKVKRAQKVERYLINDNEIEKINYKTEDEFNRRLEQAANLIEEVCKRVELNIERLYKLNASIEEPFVKNQTYYEQRIKQVSEFLERDYKPIIEAYFLMGIICLEEYEFHRTMQKRLQKMIEEICVLQMNKDEIKLLTKQALLLRYFLENSEAAPKAGIIRHNKRNYRSLMQIEQERCYSEEFRNDEFVKMYYRNL